MLSKISRRRFVGNTAVVYLCPLIPRLVGAAWGAAVTLREQVWPLLTVSGRAETQATRFPSNA